MERYSLDDVKKLLSKGLTKNETLNYIDKLNNCELEFAGGVTALFFLLNIINNYHITVSENSAMDKCFLDDYDKFNSLCFKAITVHNEMVEAKDKNVEKKLMTYLHTNIIKYYYYSHSYFKALDYIHRLEDINSNADSTLYKILIIEELIPYNYRIDIKAFDFIVKLLNGIDVEKCEYKQIVKLLKKKYSNFINPLNLEYSLPKKVEVEKMYGDKSEEKIFFIENLLVLNPLNKLIFKDDCCPAEGFDDTVLHIADEENRELLNSIINDYYFSRKQFFDISKKNSISDQEFSSIVIFAYTIFDKVAYLINKILKIMKNENKVYFNIFKNEKIFSYGNKNLIALYNILRETEKSKKHIAIR